MFIKNWGISPVANTSKLNILCDNCNNEAENEIFEEPYGINVGLIFMKKPLLSLKRYWFVCPVCKSGTKQLTKEQVKAYKVK